jgi:hypothetical protein
MDRWMGVVVGKKDTTAHPDDESHTHTHTHRTYPIAATSRFLLQLNQTGYHFIMKEEFVMTARRARPFEAQHIGNEAHLLLLLLRARLLLLGYGGMLLSSSSVDRYRWIRVSFQVVHTHTVCWLVPKTEQTRINDIPATDVN